MFTEKLLHGGDYYPEQWLERPEILETDIAYMKEAHINVVTLGVFAWSVLEPEEGQYQLDWLKEIIDRLYANGISVILATPSGARPVWMAEKYPEVLRTDETGTKQLFGGRHNHCFTSPVYREKVRLINLELAKTFGNHPGVILWHISNEYNGSCHCPLCQKAFQSWLENRYGTIEKLNKSWWTTFWSHRYQSFSQIHSPSSFGEKEVHGLNLDWKRFVTDQTTDFLKAEIRALREGGASQPATTNLMYDFKGLNYGKLAEAIDIVSWDNYPLWHKEKDIDIAIDTGMQHDYMRSLKHKPFLLMESCPSGPNWQSVSKLKKPGILLNASLQAVAHGSDSVLYFQIRQSLGSSEKFHGAVIDHSGRDDTRVFREVCAVGDTLKSLQELAGSRVNTKAALIYDVESRWAMEDSQGPRNKGMYYHESARKSYRALRRYGLDVDVIDMDQTLDGYQMIAAPMLYLFRSGIEEKLRTFVENGGTLIMTYWSGVADETDLCFTGDIPHHLTDVLGLRTEEIDSLYDTEKNHAVPVFGNPLGITRTYACEHLCELVHADQAEILMAYQSDFYAGKPILTCNTFGKGHAYYICADMEPAFYDDIYERILYRHEIRGMISGIPDCIEVSSRETEQNKYVFVQNYSPDPVKIKLPEGAAVLAGSTGDTIDGYASAVWKFS